MGAIRVLVADDEADVRSALADLVDSEDGLELVGVARDAEEAVRLAVESRPDVALVDVKMPGGGGARAARDIARMVPQTRVLALSAHEDRGTVVQMLGAGAIGYLVKGTAPDEIVRAITRAVRGQTSLSSEVMAGVVHELTSQLRREELTAEGHRERLERIHRAMERDRMTMVYQPIWDLRSRSPVGMEALARFAGPPERPPDQWFAEAGQVGLKTELELFALRMALHDLVRLPSGLYLSLNMSHRTAGSEQLLDTFADSTMERIVAEITEHEPVEDYATLGPALDRLRLRGARVAIDDAGAGFASLRHTLQINLDIIKLDISLTRDIDSDRRRRALATALISFADEMGMAIVAEGIETQAELDTLLALGAHFGQGFFLARPAPLP